MNASQIKCIRECLRIRERQLIDRFGNREETPDDILLYEKKVNEWHEQSRAKTRTTINAIRSKIRLVEEQIILGEVTEGMAKALQELDAWTPTNTNK